MRHRQCIDIVNFLIPQPFLYQLSIIIADFTLLNITRETIAVLQNAAHHTMLPNCLTQISLTNTPRSVYKSPLVHLVARWVLAAQKHLDLQVVDMVYIDLIRGYFDSVTSV
jgi:hypothetical protein